MYCQCEQPAPRATLKPCANCGRDVRLGGLISTALYQNELLNALNSTLTLQMLTANRPVRPLTLRQKVARRIKETRRRIRNAEAAIKGAWEADEDY
jgi:hypothetical protein